MNAWDWFALGMFLLAIAPLAAFAFLYWRDERRNKKADRLGTIDVTITADASKAIASLARLDEAMRRYREHR